MTSMHHRERIWKSVKKIKIQSHVDRAFCHCPVLVQKHTHNNNTHTQKYGGGARRHIQSYCRSSQSGTICRKGTCFIIRKGNFIIRKVTVRKKRLSNFADVFTEQIWLPFQSRNGREFETCENNPLPFNRDISVFFWLKSENQSQVWHSGQIDTQ